MDPKPRDRVASKLQIALRLPNVPCHQRPVGWSACGCIWQAYWGSGMRAGTFLGRAPVLGLVSPPPCSCPPGHFVSYLHAPGVLSWDLSDDRNAWPPGHADSPGLGVPVGLRVLGLRPGPSLPLPRLVLPSSHPSRSGFPVADGQQGCMSHVRLTTWVLVHLAFHT